MAHQVGMPTPNFHNHESSFKLQDCLTCHEIFFLFVLINVIFSVSSRLWAAFHWGMAIQQPVGLGMPFSFFPLI